MADPTSLSAAERAKLEARRDRLMQLLNEGGGPDGGSLDADDRADLVQEWNRIDAILQRR